MNGGRWLARGAGRRVVLLLCSRVQHAVPSTPPCASPCTAQRLPLGVVLRHRLLARRLAGGRAPARVQGAGRGTAGGERGGGGGSGSGSGRAAVAVAGASVWQYICSLLCFNATCSNLHRSNLQISTCHKIAKCGRRHSAALPAPAAGGGGGGGRLGLSCSSTCCTPLSAH